MPCRADRGRQGGPVSLSRS